MPAAGLTKKNTSLVNFLYNFLTKCNRVNEARRCMLVYQELAHSTSIQNVSFYEHNPNCND